MNIPLVFDERGRLSLVLRTRGINSFLISNGIISYTNTNQHRYGSQRPHHNLHTQFTSALVKRFAASFDTKSDTHELRISHEVHMRFDEVHLLWFRYSEMMSCLKKSIIKKQK